MPQHKRGPWSQQEDQLLIRLVSVHGASNWVRISTQIQTRSPKQCRERFHQNLKPNLNHEPITAEEGVLIEQMVAEMGKRWAEIARRLRGRSDNAVKNWWNGGMNRRRRNNQQRRTEFEVRNQMHVHPHMHALPSVIQQQPLPPAFQHMMPQQFFAAQPMFHPGHAPQHISVPSNVAGFPRHGMLVETPLPSPSAFSQMSAENAPSLISDSSSLSGRSPHNGASPIELPPLADGVRDDRRLSSAPLLRVGMHPHHHAYVHDPSSTDYGMPPHMHMQQRFEEHPHMPKAPPMLQEPFMPQPQLLPQPTAFLPSQPRQPSPLQFDSSVHMASRRPQQSAHPAQRMPSTPTVMQLPSIGKLATDDKSALGFDPALATPGPVASSPEDGSPRDKMSLSNLTHH